MLIYRHIYAGLGAGAVGAILAVLVSLPLHSPDDIRLNAATVGFGTVIVGGITGLLWHLSRSEDGPNQRYWAYSLAMGLAVIAFAALAQTQIDDAMTFTIPLALIAVIVSVVGTPFAATNQRIGNWLSALLVTIAVVMSVALAGQGDQESGSLSLPPPP